MLLDYLLYKADIVKYLLEESNAETPEELLEHLVIYHEDMNRMQKVLKEVTKELKAEIKASQPKPETIKPAKQKEEQLSVLH